MTDFEPIPKLWRFHALYLLVTGALAWSFYPFPGWDSILLLVMLCGVGLLFAYFDLHMSVHILATVIGLGAPIIILIRPLWTTTAVFLLLFAAAVTLFRKHLF